MFIPERLVEQRKHHRFPVGNVALVSFAPDPGEPGEVIDISLGGLSFRYFGEKVQRKKSSRLNILSWDGGPSVRDLPFEKVSDVTLFDDLTVGSLTRRGSVRFGHLTRSQLTALVHLIEHHTTLAEKLSVTPGSQRFHTKERPTAPLE